MAPKFDYAVLSAMDAEKGVLVYFPDERINGYVYQSWVLPEYTDLGKVIAEEEHIRAWWPLKLENPFAPLPGAPLMKSIMEKSQSEDKWLVSPIQVLALGTHEEMKKEYRALSSPTQSTAAATAESRFGRTIVPNQKFYDKADLSQKASQSSTSDQPKKRTAGSAGNDLPDTKRRKIKTSGPLTAASAGLKKAIANLSSNPTQNQVAVENYSDSDSDDECLTKKLSQMNKGQMGSHIRFLNVRMASLKQKLSEAQTLLAAANFLPTINENLQAVLKMSQRLKDRDSLSRGKPFSSGSRTSSSMGSSSSNSSSKHKRSHADKENTSTSSSSRILCNKSENQNSVMPLQRPNTPPVMNTSISKVIEKGDDSVPLPSRDPPSPESPALLELNNVEEDFTDDTTASPQGNNDKGVIQNDHSVVSKDIQHEKPVDNVLKFGNRYVDEDLLKRIHFGDDKAKKNKKRSTTAPLNKVVNGLLDNCFSLLEQGSHTLTGATSGKYSKEERAAKHKPALDSETVDAITKYCMKNFQPVYETQHKDEWRKKLEADITRIMKSKLSNVSQHKIKGKDEEKLLKLKNEHNEDMDKQKSLKHIYRNKDKQGN